MIEREIAKWVSRSGKHTVTLYANSRGFYYKAQGCGGNFGAIGIDEALQEMERRVALNFFQPDSNKTPMKKVKV